MKVYTITPPRVEITKGGVLDTVLKGADKAWDAGMDGLNWLVNDFPKGVSAFMTNLAVILVIAAVMGIVAFVTMGGKRKRVRREGLELGWTKYLDTYSETLEDGSTIQIARFEAHWSDGSTTVEKAEVSKRGLYQDYMKKQM